MPRDVETPWYTRGEAAKYLRMSVDTLSRCERDGQIVRREMPDGRFRFHVEDLDCMFVARGQEES